MKYYYIKDDPIKKQSELLDQIDKKYDKLQDDLLQVKTLIERLKLRKIPYH